MSKAAVSLRPSTGSWPVPGPTDCHIYWQDWVVKWLDLVVTDGGFRPDGTFVRWPGWPAYDGAALSEAFRRVVLRLFVRRG